MDRGVMVLLAGNGVRNASILEDHLLKRGCSIFFATSKKEAIDLLQRRPFDVVLTSSCLAMALPTN